MLTAASKLEATTANDAEQELTDGFHLIIDALKLNGLNTIYGVPGIPITDLGRMTSRSIRCRSARWSLPGSPAPSPWSSTIRAATGR